MKDDESQNSRMEDHGLAPADDRAETQEPEVNHSRRNLARAGVAAPILMTLASRPVFGNPVNGQCLSNIMSGNLSTQNNGNCSLGAPPKVWSDPSGPILNSFLSSEAWESLDFASLGLTDTFDVLYGTLPSTASGFITCADYEGGATLGNTPLAPLATATVPATTPLRQIMCDDPASSISLCVAAWLNARYSANRVDYNYILDEGDVIKFCVLGAAIPLNYSLDDFLKYTFQY